MKLTRVAVLAGLGLAVAHLQAQTPPAGDKPAFDVVSIKPSKPGTQPHSSMENGRLTAESLPLVAYITSAWDLILSREELDAMEAHLPKWVSTDTFAINARADGNPTQEQMRLMLQALLADRFGLQVHFETAQTPVLALVLDKRGERRGQSFALMVKGRPATCTAMCSRLFASNSRQQIDRTTRCSSAPEIRLQEKSQPLFPRSGGWVARWWTKRD